MRLVMKIFHIPAIIFFLLLTSIAIEAQNRCLSADEAQKVIASIPNPAVSADAKAIRKELIELQKAHVKLSITVQSDYQKNQPRVAELNRLGDTNVLRVCQILKQSGWPTPDVLKDEGGSALQYLISNSRAIDMQRELMPVLVAASKNGDIPKAMLADLVDNIRIGSGYPQIFGTQATRRGDVIYIYPMLDDLKTDEWRAAYNLPPLAQQIKNLEARFLLPVLISPRLSGQPSSLKGPTDVSALGIDNSEETLKVETKIVNLNVRAFTRDFKPAVGVSLGKDDFTIVEDGVEQETTFFSTDSAPFDMVLLLDFSGSTQEKRSLIKKAAKRFVEVARPDDRVAVIAFADDQRILSELTSDKSALYDSIDKIKNEGGSAVWDSLKFAYERIFAKKTPGRRTAVVFMTDGFDNSSKSTYADLMEVVRRGDTTVFPVCVKFSGSDESTKTRWGRMSATAEASLSMLADVSGGQFYKADDLKDLNGIYEQVVNDIGRIYSLGYEPKNEKRDGGWRTVTVKIKTHPELLGRTRHGYYAK